jgi:hypothetical protein
VAAPPALAPSRLLPSAFLCCAFAEGKWLPEDSDPIDPWNGLVEQFQTLADYFRS